MYYIYKWKIIIVIIVLAFGGFFFLDKYQKTKKDNVALNLKILSSKKDKKIPVPWNSLGKKNETPQRPREESRDKISTLEQSTNELMDMLTKNMKKLNNIELGEVDENIKIANEIILREPDSYSAYKAKMMLMILKESKFKQDIDDYEFNRTLESIASFEVTKDSKMRREAALIAVANNQQLSLENKLEDILLLRDEISLQSAALDKSSSEYFELKFKDEQLAINEEMAARDLEGFKNSVWENDYVVVQHDEDIIEIPFLRMMAKNDYEAVVENAQDLIAEFPDSISGYYYLIRALELQGKMDEAIHVIKNSKLSSEAQRRLQDKLDVSAGDDFEHYWEKLKF